MNDDEDFSSYPLSVSEIKSDKSQKSIDWSPRDLLLRVLRDIDSGKISPKTLIMFTSEEHEDDKVTTNYYASGALIHLVATIELGKFRYLSEAEQH